MDNLFGGLAAVAAVTLACTSGVQAAAITVYCTIGVQSAVEEMVPKFEQATGHKLNIVFNTSAGLNKRVQDGDVVDVLIGTRGGLAALIKDGKVTAGTEVILASSGVGIAVRKGLPKPDISTPEALKQALLAAKSISYSNPAAGGASGVHFAKVLERLGIVEEIKAKTKYAPAGGFAANLLVSGEADMAVQQGPELLSVSGIDIVGPLPGDLQAITEFAAGMPANAREPGAAKALIEFLRTPEAKAVMKSKGLDVN
jgi:molybdate transport system substrate-binding protein